MNSLGFSASDEVKPDGSKFSSRLRHQSGFKFTRTMDFEILSEGESLIQDSDNTDAEAKHQPPVNDDAEIKPSSNTLASLSQCNYLLFRINYSLLPWFDSKSI